MSQKSEKDKLLKKSSEESRARVQFALNNLRTNTKNENKKKNKPQKKQFGPLTAQDLANNLNKNVLAEQTNEDENIEDLNKGEQIKADLYSRPNAINGKYQIAGLDDLIRIEEKDTFFLETLRMKANLADKLIKEAESQGKNTDDPEIMKELGVKINDAGTPITKTESIMSAIFVSLQLVIYYGVALGIWGLVFKKSFLTFSLYGFATGLLFSLLSAGPVVAAQRTKEQVRNISSGVGLILGNLGLVIGIVGLIALVIRLIFFN